MNAPIIAVIDDDLSVRLSLQRILAHAGYSVVAFSSAQTFCSLSRRDKPACLVVDVHMPDMSGPEMLEALDWRNQHPSRPVIFITGDADLEDNGALLGFADVPLLQKPFDDTQLLAALNAVLTTNP